MSDWQPIETAPKDQQVLVWDGTFRCIAVNWSNDLNFWVDEQGRMDEQPTHWMPLPEPPK